MGEEKFWNERLILKTYAGSIAYGTNTPESDIDYRGVCVPPEEYLLGLKKFEQKENNDGKDEVIFALDKYVSLAMNCNPNILDILFCRDSEIVYINDFGLKLKDFREEFVSKRAYKTYGGYAYSMLKRMTRVEKNAIGKRADSVHKLGYDTKNALHCVRLLRMGIEILEQGKVFVYRDDKEDLLRIRRGEFSLQDIENEAERLLKNLNEANDKSTLKEAPDYEKVNKWLISMHKEALIWNP